MDRIAAWFTPKRRKAIYGLGAALFALLSAFGAITVQQNEQYGQILATALAALTNLMAFLNTNVEVDETPFDAGLG